MIATTTSIAAAATAPAPTAEISASQGSVRYGKHVRLEGTAPGLSDATIEIGFRRAGSDTWKPVRTTQTDPAGAYEARVNPRRAARSAPCPRADPPPRRFRSRCARSRSCASSATS